MQKILVFLAHPDVFIASKAQPNASVNSKEREFVVVCFP
jgi:hypothetical protein